MSRPAFTLALIVSLSAPSLADEPVYFADANLRAVVEEALWIADPTPADMLGMTFLDGGARDIQNLTGLEHATNLLTLWLGDNQQISDVSPLSSLTNLTMLVLNQNRISDILPLSGLVNLRDLDVHHNRIGDISALAGMTKLRRLSVRENPVSDITVLSGLANLDDLILSFTQVSDISPLLGLTRLRRLDLRDCPLDRSILDIHLAQIRANNPGIQLLYDEIYSHVVTISSTSGGSVINPGEGQFSFEHGETVILIARTDPGFMFLRWSGGHEGTQNPVSLTISTGGEIRAHFLDLSRSLFVDGHGPCDPAPGDPTVSDPFEDGSPARPFDTIREAVEAATPDTSIFVRPGTYHENVDPLGKRIRIIGISPEAPHETPYPVIAGDGTSPAVSFTSGETADCMLIGFVVTRTQADPASAVYCHAAGPTIANCLIVGNRSTGPDSSTVYCCDSRAVLTNCTITDNVAGEYGAAVYLSGGAVVITNSILWGNTPTEILLAGANTSRVTYSNITGGWSDSGALCADPLFARAGCWADPEDLDRILGPDDPRAVRVAGDYHLRSQAGRRNLSTSDWHLDSTTSPCIDAGDPNSPPDEEPRPNGGLINLGAYGGTPHASRSATAP